MSVLEAHWYLEYRYFTVWVLIKVLNIDQHRYILHIAYRILRYSECDLLDIVDISNIADMIYMILSITILWIISQYRYQFWYINLELDIYSQIIGHFSCVHVCVSSLQDLNQGLSATHSLPFITEPGIISNVNNFWKCIFCAFRNYRWSTAWLRLNS